MSGQFATTYPAYPGTSQVSVAPPDPRGAPGSVVWSFTVSGTPAANNYFICNTGQSPLIQVGDTFRNSGSLGGPFTVVSMGAPFVGFVNVFFTPNATGIMSSGTVTGVSTPKWKYMSSIGQMTALDWSFSCPGGCFAASWTVMVPATYRDEMFNPGNLVRITRGGHQVWAGKLDEPVSTASGWNFTATGDGSRGSDFVAYYTDTWPTSQPDESINDAISRGMPWVNSGIGTPTGIWLGQSVDPGAQFISDLLNLVCTRGGLTWYVNSQPGGQIGSSVSVFPLPTVVNRFVVCTQPVPRTLGGYINTLFIRYESVADNSTTGATAAFATTSVQNTQSSNIHGVIEDFIDLSSAGVLTLAQAQAVGNYILQIYQAATFAGPFTANYGQLLTPGGQPIDPATDQAGTVVQVIATDFGYGGEVTPQFPITFLVGQYAWDDFAQVATITPFQALDQSISGLISAQNTVLTPITVSG